MMGAGVRGHTFLLNAGGGLVSRLGSSGIDCFADICGGFLCGISDHLYIYKSPRSRIAQLRADDNVLSSLTKLTRALFKQERRAS